MEQVINFFTPNKVWGRKPMILALIAWIVLMFMFWYTRSAAIPRPLAVIGAFPRLLESGMLVDLGISILLNLEALLLSTIISLILSYSTVYPWMRPAVGAVVKMCFLGLTGLTYFFTLATSGGHQMKVAILVFGMTAYFTRSMVDVVAKIPKVNFDHVRTMRSNEFRVVWEVVIRGTRDQAIDVMRQNAAVGWMMLTMVEALCKGDGGIGVMLVNADKFKYSMAPVMAIQVVILIVGLTNDALIFGLKKLLCEYAFVKLERK